MIDSRKKGYNIFDFRWKTIGSLKPGFSYTISIPIKMEDFFDAEISIYSVAEFFIYLFEDFIQRFYNETPCPQIFLKDVRRFSTKHIKCRYLHKINEKSRTGINGYFCIKNPLLWEWHFHKLLCEEMIFILPSGKNYHFFPCAVEISFLHTKVCGNAPFIFVMAGREH